MEALRLFSKSITKLCEKYLGKMGGIEVRLDGFGDDVCMTLGENDRIITRKDIDTLISNLIGFQGEGFPEFECGRKRRIKDHSHKKTVIYVHWLIYYIEESS
jgi:hypothetical protein